MTSTGKPQQTDAGAEKTDLQKNAEKALELKTNAAPEAHIPDHRTPGAGRVKSPQLGYTDTAIGREPTFTPNLKRSHNARTGDA